MGAAVAAIPAGCRCRVAASAYSGPKGCGGVPQSSGEPGKWSRWNAESSGKCQRLAVRAGAGADLGAIVGIPAAGATLPARPLPALRAETTRLGPTVGASSAGSGCRWLGASRRRIRPARRRLDLAPDVSCGPAYEGNCLLDVFTPGADDCTWGAYVFPRPAYERDCLPTTRIAGLWVFPAGLRLHLPRLRRRRRFSAKRMGFRLHRWAILALRRLPHWRFLPIPAPPTRRRVAHLQLEGCLVGSAAEGG